MALKAKILVLFALLVLSCTTTEASKLKKTRIQFYMHEVFGGTNPTAVRVATPINFTSPNSLAPTFGDIFIVDNPLTVTPNPNSTVIARAQGLYALSSQNEVSLLMSVTIGFSSGTYNSSTFSILGRNPIMNAVREMPVVGGSGIFRLARGYCFAQTHSVVNLSRIVGYNVTLLHY